MKYSTFKFLNYKDGAYSIDEKALKEFAAANSNGEIAEEVQAKYLKTELLITIGPHEARFNKLEVEFLKELYDIEYDVIEPHELMLWKAVTLTELISMCKESSTLARLAEVEIRSGNVFIYEIEGEDDYAVLIKLV